MSESNVDEIERTVAPIIKRTYGDNGMSRALVAHLADRIARDDFGSRGRQWDVMIECWNWFSGGTTAENVALRIEAALSDRVRAQD